jgi:hypothetical protein
LRDPQVTRTLWITMNVIHILILALLALSAAACGDDANPYPTEARQTRLADGSIVEVYGATTGDVCEAMADIACDTGRCRLDFYARCNPSARGGLVEVAQLELWDKLWSDCLATVERLDGYRGLVQPAGCERLTPFWSTGE